MNAAQEALLLGLMLGGGLGAMFGFFIRQLILDWKGK